MDLSLGTEVLATATKNLLANVNTVVKKTFDTFVNQKIDIGTLVTVVISVFQVTAKRIPVIFRRVFGPIAPVVIRIWMFLVHIFVQNGTQKTGIKGNTFGVAGVQITRANIKGAMVSNFVFKRVLVIVMVIVTVDGFYSTIVFNRVD